MNKSEEVKVPFFSSMVTVSLAHFMRNLDLGGATGQPEAVGKRALRSLNEEMSGNLPHKLHLGSVSLQLEVGLSWSTPRCEINTRVMIDFGHTSVINALGTKLAYVTLRASLRYTLPCTSV